ncbi:MAG: hypothetical protein ACJ75J_15890 [Cytophagaceae bacterium]
MKRYTMLYITLLAIVVNFSFVMVKADEDEPALKRGAKSSAELSEIFINSVRQNDFSMLRNYIPEQTEMEYFRKSCSIQQKPLCESIDDEELKSNTESNYRKLVQRGIDKELNWSQIELIDKKTISDPKNNLRSRVVMNVQDMKGKSMKMSFDVIQIKDKYFIFQGIREGN